MRWDADKVIYRLEDAGRTLLLLPPEQRLSGLTAGSLRSIEDALERAQWFDQSNCRIVPSVSAIDRMNESLGWIALIDPDRCGIRRVVAARALVRPDTGKHLFAWWGLGRALGFDHNTMKLWHRLGIGFIVAALNGAET